MSTDITEQKEVDNSEDVSPDKRSTDNDEPPENKEQQPQSSLSNTVIETKSKIDVLLKPAGDAPIMKKKRWAVERNKRVSWISEFIKKYLKLDPKNLCFYMFISPLPLHLIQKLAQCLIVLEVMANLWCTTVGPKPGDDDTLRQEFPSQISYCLYRRL
ncbi:LOW QUALITY PROTEIN: autophagy protein 12-like [Argopecten irradians]|uniref:LOW QUALITY PROTEIN: autophagy protein 12-like n=1 Tax=Argopecten irradians TaxID=31199 RepID=UPI0037237CA4